MKFRFTRTAQRKRRRCDDNLTDGLWRGLEPLEPRLLMSVTFNASSFPDGVTSFVDFNKDGWVDAAVDDKVYKNNGPANPGLGTLV